MSDACVAVFAEAADQSIGGFQAHLAKTLHCLKPFAATKNCAAVKLRICQLGALAEAASSVLQALAANTNAQQQTLVRLQRNTVLACNDELKELSSALGHLRLQVLLLCLCRCTSMFLQALI